MKEEIVKAKLPKSIKSITVLKAETGRGLSSEPERVTVEPKRRRKKRSKGLLRIWERMVRRSAKAAARSAEEYRDRHERSNEKRRDGWLREYVYNVVRAGRKGRKAFKLSKLFG